MQSQVYALFLNIKQLRRMKFLQNVLASFTALFLFFGFVAFVFLVSLFSMEKTESYRVKDNTVLKIRLDRMLADREVNDPFATLAFGSGARKRMGLVPLREALQAAATDDKVKGIALYAPQLIGGIAMGSELRQALAEFKQSGKFIWAYADLMSEGAYYVASVADRIYLAPEGMVEWNGLGAELTFFKNTFDKLEIEPQIFRVGEFKSAVEPFMLDKMSPENRLQMNALLNSIYSQMISDMATDLQLDTARLRFLSDNMKVHDAGDALEAGLITHIAYEDEFIDAMAAELGLEEADDINWASYKQYNKSLDEEETSDNKIAVVVAEGEIMMSGKQSDIITPDKYIKILRKLRDDDEVKAVVLRVNSPGGDALASDLIWHEVAETAKVKPVIASMANVAASGGYYISMAADTIVAQPTTITGSIGIFGIIFNVGDFMAHKLGITTDQVSTGQFTHLFTSSRALTDAEKAIIQEQVNNGYETFTTKAAQGRDMPLADLLAVASGRVWTGAQAKEIGLVDELGGLPEAIRIAAAAAGIDNDYRVTYEPSPLSAFEQFLEDISGQVRVATLKQELGDLYPYVHLLDRVKNMQRLQARMPFELEVK